jgi:hypothetical protein
MGWSLDPDAEARLDIPAVVDAIERWCAHQEGDVRCRFDNTTAEDFIADTYSVQVKAAELVATAHRPGWRPVLIIRGLHRGSDPAGLVAELDELWAARVAALRPISRAAYLESLKADPNARTARLGTP